MRFRAPSCSLVMIVSLAALGCHAQSGAPSHEVAGSAYPIQVGVKLSPEMERRVEVMIRNRSNVSLDYSMSLGAPTPSELPGYDQIPVTFTLNGKSITSMQFQISTDGRALAQFNKFDISHDPREQISIKGRPGRGGPEDAPVLIVGFDDLECPYCAQMNATLFPAVLDRYKNQVRVVYRDFPLYDIHPWAMHAAVNANCLGSVSTAGYWNFVDYVHAHANEIMGVEKAVDKANQTLDKLALDEGARQKVDASALAACVQKQDSNNEKAALNEAAGDPLRIDSAPVLFVNGEKILGVIPIGTLDRIIDEALRAQGLTPPPPPLPNSLPAVPLAPPADVRPAAAPTAAKPGS